MDRWLRRYFDETELSENMPVDVLPASNGEFVPPPPTREAAALMALQDEKAEDVRRTMGLSRREFVRTGVALGVGFWAIGQVMGGRMGPLRAGRFVGCAEAGVLYHDRADDLAFPEAQLDNLAGEFIFDIQTPPHRLRRPLARQQPGLPCRVHRAVATVRPARRLAWCQTARPCTASVPSRDRPIENLSRYHYMKELYLDSSRR